MSKSNAEEMLNLEMRGNKLRFEREFHFHPKRRWRFDFAFPELKLAVEVEGITSWGKNQDGSMKLGRHQSAKGIEADMEKYQEALLLGWTIYRCSPRMVESGQAIHTILCLHERLTCQ